MDCSSPGSSVHGDSPGKNTAMDCHALTGELPNPSIEPRSPALQMDSVPSETPGKSQNTGVSSQSLLQGILGHAYLPKSLPTNLPHYSWELSSPNIMEKREIENLYSGYITRQSSAGERQIHSSYWEPTLGF